MQNVPLITESLITQRSRKVTGSMQIKKPASSFMQTNHSSHMLQDTQLLLVILLSCGLKWGEFTNVKASWQGL